jgi:PAS domain S-box-containing protein
MSKTLQIVIVEDLEDEAELLLSTLRHGGYDPISKRVYSADTMKAVLEEQPWDVVISDYTMPDFSASDALTILKERDLEIPFIVVSGTLGAANVVAALKAGAHDFLPKEDLSQLIPTLERELHNAIVRRERKQAKKARVKETKRHTAELEQHVLERTVELNRTKDRLVAILNSSSDAIILANADGMIQQVNPAFNDLLGYTSDEALERSLLIISAPDFVEQLDREMQSVVQMGQSKRIEITLLRKDGISFDGDLALSPIIDGDEIGSIVCSLHDITERKREEKKLQKALEKEKELNELKTRFVSMVSHDIRTPLTIIQMSAETLQKYSDHLSKERKAKYFEKIQSQIKRMTTLLNDVLTVSQGEVGEFPFHPFRISLDRVCQGIIDDFQEMLGLEHTLVYSCANEPTTVLVDEKLVHQAIMNLLTNAFKYSPIGSTVYVDLSFEESNAVIRVKDSGIGIPKADQKRLFEVFRRARNVGAIAGTGLGLAIVKQSVETHGGTVSFETQVGVGTTFIVTLPIHLEQEKHS